MAAFPWAENVQSQAFPGLESKSSFPEVAGNMKPFCFHGAADDMGPMWVSTSWCQPTSMVATVVGPQAELGTSRLFEFRRPMDDQDRMPFLLWCEPRPEKTLDLPESLQAQFANGVQKYSSPTVMKRWICKGQKGGCSRWSVIITGLPDADLLFHKLRGCLALHDDMCQIPADAAFKPRVGTSALIVLVGDGQNAVDLQEQRKAKMWADGARQLASGTPIYVCHGREHLVALLEQMAAEPECPVYWAGEPSGLAAAPGCFSG